MFDLSPELSVALADALIHESLDTFLLDAVPCLLHNPNFDQIGRDEKAAKLFLTFMYSSLPRSGNGFSFAGVSSVGRNDPCPCGSGKKFKKCCTELLDIPAMPAEAVFDVALDALSPEQAIALVNKPGWTLKALGMLMTKLLEIEQFETVYALFKAHVTSLDKLRNEHEFMVASVLDAMFELAMDDERLALMQRLTKLTKASSLQSIGFQRLAMNFAQKGEEALAKELLQKAFRADPNQAELPISELSILSLNGTDDEIKARATYWHKRLSRLYGDDDYPLAEIIEGIRTEGKALLMGGMPTPFEDADFNPEDLSLAVDYAKRLLAILSIEVHELPVRIRDKNGEGQITYLRGKKKLSTQMIDTIELCLNDQMDIYPDMEPMEASVELWYSEDDRWLVELERAPELINEPEVLMYLNNLVSSAPASLADSGLFDRLSADFQMKLEHTVLAILATVRANQLTLPSRFKANKAFWGLAKKVSDNAFWDEVERGDRARFMQDLWSIESKPYYWLLESLALSLLANNQSNEVIELLVRYKKMPLPLRLILACAYHKQNKMVEALAQLKTLYEGSRQELEQFKLCLKEGTFQGFELDTVTNVLLVLMDNDLADLRQWLLGQLPDKQ